MKAKASSLVFIASLFVGILISMNININNKSTFLSAEDYTELYNERLKLYSDINNLEKEYKKLQLKYNKYKLNDISGITVIREIQKEINDKKNIIGLAPVKGEGIRITITDAKFGGFNSYLDSQKFVHDSDIAQILNDLRNAGAEAIAINGQRIMFNTYSYCGGTSIDLGGVKVVAPFYIEVIGNKTVLKNFLILNDSHYKQLVLRGIQSNIETLDEVKIPAYTGKVEIKYIKNKFN